jgi:hypothetical protein
MAMRSQLSPSNPALAAILAAANSAVFTLSRVESSV